MVIGLQAQICRFILLQEKIERLLNKRLSKKVRLSIVTVAFALGFAFVYLSPYIHLPQRYSLHTLRQRHKQFRDYAFVGLEDTAYTKGLVVINTGLYLIQLACWVGVFDLNKDIKHAVTSATVSSTMALARQVKLSDQLEQTEFGTLFSRFKKTSIPLSSLCGLAYFFLLKPDLESVINKKILLNERNLWQSV